MFSGEFEMWKDHFININFYKLHGRLRGLTGSALDQTALPPEFESRPGHVWMVFH